MAIYGVALLAICTLLGALLGDILGVGLGVKTNVGGVGIAMILLMAARVWLMRKGVLTLGHARAMLTLPDAAKIVPDVVKRGLSVRQTERLVQRLLTGKPPAKAGPDTEQVERDLAAQIGYRVKVSASPRGDGSLTIWFNDLFQLDDLIARLSGMADDRAKEHD